MINKLKGLTTTGAFQHKLTLMDGWKLKPERRLCMWSPHSHVNCLTEKYMRTSDKSVLFIYRLAVSSTCCFKKDKCWVGIPPKIVEIFGSTSWSVSANFTVLENASSLRLKFWNPPLPVQHFTVLENALPLLAEASHLYPTSSPALQYWTLTVNRIPRYLTAMFAWSLAEIA